MPTGSALKPICPPSTLVGMRGLGGGGGGVHKSDLYNSAVIDGWITCDFTSFSTVFQSYQDNQRVIMKGYF